MNLETKNRILNALKSACGYVMQQNSKTVAGVYVSANIPALNKLEQDLRNAEVLLGAEDILGATFCGRKYCPHCLRDMSDSEFSLNQLCGNCVQKLQVHIHLLMDNGVSKIELVRKLKGSSLKGLSLHNVCDFIDFAIKQNW